MTLALACHVETLCKDTEVGFILTLRPLGAKILAKDRKESAKKYVKNGMVEQ
jgi:hypothetical protein